MFPEPVVLCCCVNSLQWVEVMRGCWRDNAFCFPLKTLWTLKRFYAMISVEKTVWKNGI